MGKPIRNLLNVNQDQLINFSFVDFASGTGYATYYGGVASGALYQLSNTPFNSNNLNSNALITGTDYQKLIDKDFDILFNVPQNIRGNAIVDVPVSFYHVGNSAAPTADVFIIARIRKWDGTTETEIAQGSSANWSAGVATTNLFNYNVRTAKIIIPATHFKAGEYLRLTIEAWAKEGQANNNRIIIYHDPANRSFMDGESYNNALVSGASILKLQLPLKIEGL